MCSTCARTHRVLPRSTLVSSDEPMRVCDRCVVDQQQHIQERRRAAEIERQRARQVENMEAQQRQRQGQGQLRQAVAAVQHPREFSQ